MPPIASNPDPPRRSVFRALLAAVLAQAILAGLSAGPRLVVGTEDTDLYHRYAARILAGQVPYRDFLVEYPPLALAFFVVPAALSRDVASFKRAFAVEMFACNALCVGLVARWAARHPGRRSVARVLGWYTGFFLILGRLVVTKYDAAPMLIGFAATLGWAAGRPRLGGVGAALGALTKVYPAALALVALGGAGDRPPRQGRLWSGRGLGAFVLTSLLGAAAWVGLGGGRGVAESIRFQSGRGFEYGSLASGGQMLAARLLGAPIAITRDHSSFATVTPWSGALLGCVFPIQAACLAGICWVHHRRGGRELIRYSAAAVLGFIAAGKVFSPQFLIWLIPFVTLLEGPVGRRARWLFLAVCAVTLLAPGVLSFCSRTSLAAICAYNGRNILVGWLLILLIFGPPAAQDSRVRPEG